MNTNSNSRKLVLQVSQDAYQALQNEAVRIDRHAFNVASEMCEKILLTLNYKSPRADLLDDDPASLKQLLRGERSYREQALRMIEEEQLIGAEAVDLLLKYEALDRERDASDITTPERDECASGFTGGES